MKCIEQPPRRRRRWARVGAVGLAAATAITLAAGAAHAIPPEDDDPPQPPPTGTLVISGNVSVTGCPGVTRDRVTVFAVSTNPESDAGGSARVSSTGSYRITDLPRGTYNVIPRLDPGLLCPYGTWSPTSRQVTAPAIGVSFALRGPVRKLRVSATGIASVLNLAVQGSGLHLDNYGPRHGQSFQLDNGSSLRWGGTSYPFTLPEIQYDLDPCWICPDLGQARFYVNDLNMSSLAVGWGSPSFRATLAFESTGREVKGWYTDAPIGGPYDSLMPDLNIDNARLAVALTPIAEGGRLSYRVASVGLSANIQATGACDVPVLGNLCDIITDYKGKVKSAIESGVRARLSAGAVRAFVATALDNHLTKLGMPTVDKVFVEGNDIVLVAYS